MIFYNMKNFLEFINEKSKFVKIPETLNLEYLITNRFITE